MQKQKFYRFAVFSALFLLIQVVNISLIKAQESKSTPEMSVVGIELGNRESAKKYLLAGHSPRLDEEGRASYYFYNQWGTQVMRLTVPSLDDPYFITEIEVFSVGKSYTKRHYQDNENGLMMTENGIFIGFRQSAMNFIVGVRNVGKANTITPKEIVKIKGEPKEQNEPEKDRRILSYEFSDIKLADGETADYQASYEFYKKTLKRFSIKLVANEEKLAKK